MRRFVTLLLAFLFFLPPAHAQRDSGMILIRDAEIENILYQWAAPMYKAAGFNPSAVQVILVQSPDLNAFTAGGQDIFMTTGLIQTATTPEEIVGVLAHETGHMAGGDVLALGNKSKWASYESILSTVLGLGVGTLTGNGQAGNAVTMIGRAGAINQFLTHSRLEESSADQAAITYMQQAGLPTYGLVTFMEKLAAQELLPPDQQNAYARTHPVTRDRITALETRASVNKHTMNEGAYAQLKRMQAKLEAFTNPSRAVNRYGAGKDATSHMVRAIAAYRQEKIDAGIQHVDLWLAQEPQNPYAYELKAQILKDGGRPADAVPVYEKALALAPREALIRIDAAHAMIESGDNAFLVKAINYLNSAIEYEPRSRLAFRLLSTAYARQGKEPEAQIYLAELSVLDRDYKRATQLLGLAQPKLRPNSPAARRARDLGFILETLDKGDKDD